MKAKIYFNNVLEQEQMQGFIFGFMVSAFVITISHKAWVVSAVFVLCLFLLRAFVLSKNNMRLLR